MQPVTHSERCGRSRRARRNDVLGHRYRLLERTGSGGSAVVYRAGDRRQGGEVALKVLHPALAEDRAAAERFRREARTGEGLQHPNLVRVFDHGVCDGLHFIAMEYVAGSSLKALIAEEGPLEPARAVALTLQILAAAEFLHGQGIVHRDLKADNVIVDATDRVKVADFGLASSGADPLTRTGNIVGTVEYMSPQRLMGESATAACDLYAIGIILYQLLTGKLPFQGELVPTVALQHLNDVPVAPNVLNDAISVGLSSVVMRALEKRRGDRFDDAAAFTAALRRESARGLTQSLLPAAA